MPIEQLGIELIKSILLSSNHLTLHPLYVYFLQGVDTDSYPRINLTAHQILCL